MTGRSAGYIELTIRVYPDADEYVGECEELGITSTGDTIEEAAHHACKEAEHYLAALEPGDRESVLRQRGLRLLPGSPPETVERSVRARAHEFVTVRALAVPEPVAKP